VNRIGRTTRGRGTATAVAAFTAVAILLAAPAGAAPPNVNLIERANFEVPIPPTEPVALLFAPGSHIGPWSVSVATVGVSRSFPPIVTGIKGRNLQFLALKDPTAAIDTPVGKVCQQVDLEPTKVYRLRFYSAAATFDDTLVVTWQGRTVGSFAETGSLGDTNWALHQIALGPAAGAVLGEVCFTGAGEGFPLVDAVDLHATTP
jgi:hypothetical protein